MADRNYMNVNDVFPILDLINRKLKERKGTTYNFESPLLNDNAGSSPSPLDSSQWQVESFEVIRDSSNTVDPNIIKEVIIVYRNGAIDTITLSRGLKPPVDDSVVDHEYINNLMIVEVSIETQLFGRSQEVVAKIIKENGHGNFQKVELTYYDSHLHAHEDGDEDIETYSNPNDFYDGGGSEEGYDTEVDEAEDFAETEYLPEDDIEPPEDGWADGFNPSTPEDVPLQTDVEVTEDFAGTEYEDEQLNEENTE
ncbi:hypothetical protein NMK43_08705 [Bacillus licheniformis]|uniref:hypothetical protein n=1 Tax=Bacillus licheniformis TaxID=1402 RepID=UPI0020C83DBA|nr:hypothetical protein [Bacillus licheniformis]MCP8973173.1 hypothetical protein [Bacillus licheniformis]